VSLLDRALDYTAFLLFLVFLFFLFSCCVA
jgi:hypothetical protein